MIMLRRASFLWSGQCVTKWYFWNWKYVRRTTCVTDNMGVTFFDAEVCSGTETYGQLHALYQQNDIMYSRRASMHVTVSMIHQ